MKRISRSFTRRRFLTVTSISALGAWAGFSNQVSAATLRGIVENTTSTMGKPQFLPNPSSWDTENITAAWLGHATVLINFYGLTILTDPVLHRRVGANLSLLTVGPKRLVAPALRAQDLPPIDLVLISHAHMDHLDPATLRDLPGYPHVVTAHATEDLLDGHRLQSPQALTWGDKTKVRTTHGEAEVQAFEVNHWGARWRYDRYRGYNGYVVSREGRRIIFGGDTAWTESFRSLKGERPYECAIMPIGAYDPWIKAHCSPEQAVRMANDAGAAYILPIHHKTFPFGREGTAQPIHRFAAALKGEEERIGWREIGQTFVLS